MWGIKSIRSGLAAVLLCFSGMASAEYFIGADAMQLGAKIAWDIPPIVQDYDLELARVRLGYQGDFFGFEVHVYSKDDDTSSSNGFDDKLELDTSYGAYLRMQEKWVYARLGVTWIDTYYTDLILGQTDRDVIAMPTGTLGIEVPIGENIGINLDYTYAEGNSTYSTISASSPNLRMQGPAVGLTLKF